MKKYIIAAAVAAVMLTAYMTMSGFIRNTSVFIEDYSVSQDGSSVTLKTGIGSSAGCIRKLAVHQRQGGKLYIDCIGAFGGINGSIGARDTFTLPLDKDTAVIALVRDADCYEEVLSRAEDGTWHRTK